jgi:hypothetical protein
LEYAYNNASTTHQNIDGNSDCLTDELYGDFTEEEYNNLVKRRKNVRKFMNKNLHRNEEEILYVPVVFHNYYEIIDGTPSRSFCDYESGNNEAGVYTNNNDSLVCIERAEKVLEILNQQFLSTQIKFIPPTDTSLVVEDIKGNGTLFIYNENWNEIRNNNNIDNVLNIYIDYCIGRLNNETEDLECGTIGAQTIYPEYISSTAPPGIAVKHSAFPGINDNSTGIIAHEIGHMFTLRHLYHLPVIKNDTVFVVVSDFQRELAIHIDDECNSRGDMICDTPGQPLQNVDDTFDLDYCIYHGFGGKYDAIKNTLKIGGSDTTGSYRNDFDNYTNLISNSNFDDIGSFWGTQGIPDSCFLSNQEEYSTECLDTLYNFLPIAANFLQWSRVMDNCLNEQDVGFTPEQLANMRYSIELDYTACSEEIACNTGLSTRSNIPPSDLFLTGESSCRFPCTKDGGCLVTDLEYQSDFSQYDCSGSLLSISGKILPEILTINKVYPNPFNPITTIRYGLAQNSDVQISIYDINGRLITTLINEFQITGYHSITWDASSYPSGIYFINISASNYSVTQKIVLIK